MLVFARTINSCLPSIHCVSLRSILLDLLSKFQRIGMNRSWWMRPSSKQAWSQVPDSEIKWSPKLERLDSVNLGWQICHFLGGGFKRFFIFNPSWGNDPIWRAYFSIGLKPPTSFGITCWLMSILNDFDECFPLWLWPPLHLGKDLGALLHLFYSIIVPEAKKDPYIILWYIMIILWSNQVILLI